MSSSSALGKIHWYQLVVTFSGKITKCMSTDQAFFLSNFPKDLIAALSLIDSRNIENVSFIKSIVLRNMQIPNALLEGPERSNKIGK